MESVMFDELVKEISPSIEQHDLDRFEVELPFWFSHEWDQNVWNAVGMQ